STNFLYSAAASARPAEDLAYSVSRSTWPSLISARMKGTMLRPDPLSIRSQISSARSNQPRCARARARSESSWARAVSDNSIAAVKAVTDESFAAMRCAPGKRRIRPVGRNSTPYGFRTAPAGLMLRATRSAEDVGVPVVDLQRQRVDRDRVHPAAFRAQRSTSGSHEPFLQPSFAVC